MPITERQRELRKKTLGGSDMAAICGLDEWSSAYAKWLERTGQVPEEDIDTPGSAAWLGNMIEHSILDMTCEHLGVRIIKNQRRVCKDAPLAANCDAMTREPNRPVEAKSVGLIRGWVDKDEWGPHDSDRVPAAKMVQVQTQIACADADAGYLGALLAGIGFRCYFIPRNDRLIDIIKEKATYFMDVNVGQGIPPTDECALEVLEKVIRAKDEVIPVKPDIVRSWAEARQARLEMEKIEKEAKRAMLQAMGTAQIADGGKAGQCKMTHVTQTKLDQKRIQTEQPDVCAPYLKEISFYRPYFKEHKDGN